MDKFKNRIKEFDTFLKNQKKGYARNSGRN